METTHKPLFGPGIASPGHRIQEKLQVVDQTTERKNDTTRTSKVVTSAKMTRIECAQTSGPEGKAGDQICHLKAQCGRV